MECVLELVMLFNLPDQGGDGISPSFTHTSRLAESETTRVGWTTSKSGRETVTRYQLDSNKPFLQAYLYSWITIPASRSPSLQGVATSQTYLIVSLPDVTGWAKLTSSF
jgi:hypothetical protein